MAMLWGEGCAVGDSNKWSFSFSGQPTLSLLPEYMGKKASDAATATALPSPTQLFALTRPYPCSAPVCQSAKDVKQGGRTTCSTQRQGEQTKGEQNRSKKCFGKGKKHFFYISCFPEKRKKVEEADDVKKGDKKRTEKEATAEADFGNALRTQTALLPHLSGFSLVLVLVNVLWRRFQRSTYRILLRSLRGGGCSFRRKRGEEFSPRKYATF